MTTSYVGAAWLLSVSPVWATFLIVAFVGTPLGMIYIITDGVRGCLPVNVSYAGQVGDLLLTVVVCIGATVLQRHEPLPPWMTSGWYQTILAILSVAAGLFVLLSGKTVFPQRNLSDYYHTMVIIPVFVFLIALTYPVIVLGGSVVELVAVVVFLAAFVYLVRFDVRERRMDQPEYVREQYGFDLNRLRQDRRR